MAERIELSSGSQGFLDTLFLFVSRKFSSKCLEDGFLENRAFLAIGLEENAF
jgi:hypothetical protein